ncbi:hypothetical protein TCON_1026 [Astathelohania contejeani]|uniref:Uncharacterized protein n=1 Tax=Astathelohania contejeani TaxID=164912 RepID=A0ABQ7I045_9MICR|nr:hypothetical protein TCON_1026 [Thelohania contejeani]
MYFTTVENENEYEVIKIDDKIFYKKKLKVSTKPKRRYSDQFKDSSFIQKDIHRKLLMMENFNTKYGDLDEKIDEWKNCISKCIEILEKEYGIPAVEIFKIFGLIKYGFDCEEFGIDIDELKTKINEE